MKLPPPQYRSLVYDRYMSWQAAGTTMNESSSYWNGRRAVVWWSWATRYSVFSAPTVAEARRPRPSLLRRS